jgi:hypothetical protein
LFTTRNPYEINDPIDLGTWIREQLAAAKHDRRSALRHDLDVGDGLLAAQKLVTGNWKRWLRDNCAPLKSARSAQVYCQLARGRKEIEAELERNPDLSQRAALRLLSPPRPKPPKPQISADVLLTDLLAKAPITVMTTALARWGFDAFVKAMPAEWRPLLEARVDGQNIQRLKQKHPNTRLKNLGRKQLALVINNGETPIQH